MLTNFADRHRRARCAAPGTPERGRSLAAFDAALQRLEADTTLSRADRMQALIARVDLARIDLPSRRASRRRRPSCRSRCSADVREQAARADREITDGYERQAVITAAAYLLEQAGLGAESDALLKANLAQEPFALLPDVRPGRATPSGAATRPRRCAGIARPSRRAKARRPGCSGARATSARWSTWRRPTRRRSKATTLQLWREAAAQPDAFEQRSARSLQRVGKKLQAWSQGGAHGASMTRLRGELDTLCAAPDRSDDRAGRLQVAADAGGEGERLSRAARRSST